jgi:hypothetical protein
MKKLILTSVINLGISFLAFSQNVASTSDSVVLANGKKVSRAELDLIFKKAWDESFGKMTPEDKKLFEGVEMNVVSEEEKVEMEE